MIDRKSSNAQLASKVGMSLNIIIRLKNDGYLSMETVEKICMALQCGVDDILEFYFSDEGVER